MRAALCRRSCADLVNGEDVGMVKTRRRARFLLEPADALLILREGGGQKLERDLAAEPRIFCQINPAHPARANQRERLIVAEAAAHEWRGLLLGGHLGDHAPYLPGDEAIRLFVRMQKRFDLAAQLVVIAAIRIKEGRARRRLQFQSSLVKLADL